MNHEKQPHWEAWGAAVVVSIAVLAGLVFKGISGETVTDAVKDIGGAVIPILAAFVAARLVTSQMDPSERIKRAGESGLGFIRQRYSEYLSGPKANRESYDPENPRKAGRYLFFQRGTQGRKAQFIPVEPLKEGIVEIRVPKTTLLILGAERESLEGIQQNILKKVQAAVTDSLERNWRGDYEILEHKHPDIAVLIDFNEGNLGPRKFRQAVIDCAESAIRELAPILKGHA